MSGEFNFCQVVIQQDNLALVLFETLNLETDKQLSASGHRRVPGGEGVRGAEQVLRQH